MSFSQIRPLRPFENEDFWSKMSEVSPAERRLLGICNGRPAEIWGIARARCGGGGVTSFLLITSEFLVEQTRRETGAILVRFAGATTPS